MTTLSVVTQPAKYHRFRYEKEVASGKLGGILHGRESSSSCVRVQVSGIDPHVHKEIIVLGATVSPELFPHPYYLHGDDCQSGAYQATKTVKPDDREMVFQLEKVSLVCTQAKGPQLEEAMRRREQMNFNPFNKNTMDMRYTTRNVKAVRLAFSVYYKDANGRTYPTGANAFTDVIDDHRKEPKLDIEEVLPMPLNQKGNASVVILLKDQLPHTDGRLYKLELKDDNDESIAIPVEIIDVKKMWMKVRTPDIQQWYPMPEWQINESIKMELCFMDLKTSESFKGVDLVFTQCCRECHQRLGVHNSGEFATKRKRATRNSNADLMVRTPMSLEGETDILDDLMQTLRAEAPMTPAPQAPVSEASVSQTFVPSDLATMDIEELLIPWDPKEEAASPYS